MHIQDLISTQFCLDELRLKLNCLFVLTSGIIQRDYKFYWYEFPFRVETEIHEISHAKGGFNFPIIGYWLRYLN